MLQLLPSVSQDCKVLVPVKLPSELPCGYLVQQACAVFCQTQDDVELGKQRANRFIPNHGPDKTSYLLSFISVIVASILWYIRLPSSCAGNYTVNIQKYLQELSMFFPVWDRNIFLWLYFFEHIKNSSISSMMKLGLELVTVKSELQGRSEQPARHLLKHQVLNCVMSGLLHSKWELFSAKAQWVCCGV